MGPALILLEHGGSPQYNLAVEEALLHAVGGHGGIVVVRVWVNPASVIVGYGLAPCMEVECGEAERLGIPVVRRITGGGAVYHDYGNVNISLFIPRRMDVESIYRLGTSVVIGALARLGLKAHVENVSDVVVGEWKVSGSAAAIKAKASLYHATLLVEADMDMLKKLVKPRLERVARGEVTPAKYNPANISDLKPSVTVGEAVNALVDSALDALGMEVGGRCGDPARLLLMRVDGEAVKLYDLKYSTRSWTYIGPSWLEAPRRRCLEASQNS